MTHQEPPGRLLKLDRNLDRLERDFAPQNLQLIPSDQRSSCAGKLFSLIGKLHAEYALGIVTALPKEFAAVRVMLDNLEEYPIAGDPNTYCVGTIPAAPSGGKAAHSIVATLLVKMGNNSAVSAATNLLRSFPNVKDVLMVGIAGAVPHPGKPQVHVRLGDVVVSHDTGVLQYDMQKITTGKVEMRDTSTPPSARVIRALHLLETNRLVGKRPWDYHIARGCQIENAARPHETTDVCYDDHDPSLPIPHPPDPERRAGQPKIHYGVIGSANILLKDPRRRDQLRDEYGVRAIEMEGSGIADGTWSHGAQYVLIRGTCDYCDDHKNDVWQGYAAVVAAAYARALVEVIPPDA